MNSYLDIYPDIRYLQVHYASVDRIPPAGDRSGVTIHYTETPQPR